MSRVRRYCPSRVMVLASSVLLLLLVGGVAFASIPDGGGVVHACYQKKGGAFRVIDTAKRGFAGKCRTSETPLAFNQQGRRGLPGSQGLKGAQGASGSQGLNGSDGQPGQPGSPAASAFTSRFTNGSLTQTLFGPVSGIGPTTNTDESLVYELSPAVTIVGRDLFAKYAESGAMPGGTRSFTLRINGADSALTCTYTTPATSCSDTSDAVTIPAGSQLSIKFFQAGTNIGGGDAIVGWRATTP